MTESIYVSNKYNTLYHSIINNAISQKRYKGEIYYENHHIHPKSFGGTDDSKNLVLLTAREHYICHYLLTKFTLSNNKHKMIYAFDFMNIDKKHKINSKLYNSNKIKKSKIKRSKEHSIKLGLSNLGRITTQETRLKLSMV